MLSNRSMPRSTVLPELAYPDISEAITRLCDAFGFTLRIRIADHRAQLNVGDGAVILIAADGEVYMRTAVMVRVEDVDRHYERARRSGMRIVLEPKDYPYGERQYNVEDFAGHHWCFSQSIADVDPREWGGNARRFVAPRAWPAAKSCLVSGVGEAYDGLARGPDRKFQPISTQEQTNNMRITGNTILITGGGSGIGRGLAEAFHALGNTVIIAGRRKHALDATLAANPGMKAVTLDVESRGGIRAFAAQMAKDYPSLNVLINNAGIMRPEILKNQQEDVADAEAIVNINLLGPIRLTAALLPQLRKQAHSVIMNVTSGLAFVPLALTPTYCATKAALRSYTQSIRYQLKGTTTEVVELVPPYVQTDLMGGASDPRAMPLDKYIAEVMEILSGQPAATEICVENVKRLRFAAENGQYDAIFNGLNDAMSKAAV